MPDLAVADQLLARALDLQFAGAEDFEGLFQGLRAAPLVGIYPTASLRTLLTRTARGAKPAGRGALRFRNGGIARRGGGARRRGRCLGSGAGRLRCGSGVIPQFEFSALIRQSLGGPLRRGRTTATDRTVR